MFGINTQVMKQTMISKSFIDREEDVNTKICTITTALIIAKTTEAIDIITDLRQIKGLKIQKLLGFVIFSYF